MAERGIRTVRTRSWIALGVVALVGAGCTPMDDLIVSVFGRSMREQPAIQSYQNPRLPAEGSVPFAAGNFPALPGQYGMGQTDGVAPPPPVTPAEMLQASTNLAGFPHINGLENPVAPDAASLARGEELYNRACVPCHAASGDGMGLVVSAGVPPRSVVSPEAQALTDGYIYSIIRAGRGAMPAYGHQLAHYDRWHLVNYVRQLQGGGAAAGASAPGNTAQGDSPDA